MIVFFARIGDEMQSLSFCILDVEKVDKIYCITLINDVQ